MGLILKTMLPFRTINLNGSISYVCELGGIRINASDTSLLTSDAVFVRDQLLNVNVKYDHSLNLPASANLVAIAGKVDEYQLVSDATVILMVAEQPVEYAGGGTVGHIISVTPSTVTTEHHQIEYSFISSGMSSLSPKNNLKGLIFVDKFTSFPTNFTHVVTSDLITNGVTVSSIDNIDYSALSVADTADSFVVYSAADQLALKPINMGDRVYRKDLHISYINISGMNKSMSDWEIFGAGDATFTADMALNTEARHTHPNKPVLDGITASFTIQQADAIVVNTAKVGITQAQSDAIIVNTAKVGITTQQAAAIVANTAKVGITQTQASAIVDSTSHRYIVAGNPHQVTKSEVELGNVPNVDFTSSVNSNSIHSAMTAGNPHQVTKADVGLSNVPNDDFTLDIVAANIHSATISGNPHHVNKTDIGLSDVPNHDFTAEVNSVIAHKGLITGNPHHVNKTDIGLGNVPDTDFTVAVSANTSHRAIVAGNPHQVTKSEVGLGNVPNVDFTADVAANTAARHNHANKAIIDATTASFTTQQATDLVTNNAKVGITVQQAAAIVANTAKVGITVQQAADIVAADAHIATVAGNPHHVTKTEVGLGNVLNIDCTNASNITTGTLPSSVLPALAITDTYVVASDIAQLVLIVQKGDIAVRTDLNKSYINRTGNNTAMSDWQELMTPLNTILSVNGKTGTVVLTSADITEGSNLYHTESRVSNNVDVAANTAARHGHANKAILDATTASFTTSQANAIVANTAKVGITVQQAAAIVANTAKVGITTQQAADITSANAHRAIVAGNPHQVTKSEVGLGNVPNTDFTSDVNANTAARHGHANKAILDATTASFTTSQANAIVANTAKVGITQAQADAIVANTAKVGITSQQSVDLISANTHRAIVSGNPHQVTKTDIGLSNVPNTDFTTDVNANTAARHGHSNKIVLDATTASFIQAQADAIVANTAKVGITTQQANAIIANTAKVGITTQQASDITSANTHRAIVAGNPHQVTKSEVGLGNVPNTDFTSDVTLNTAARHIHANKAIIDATTASFTSAQANDITINNAKIGITSTQALAIIANTAKVGITTQQASDILTADAHVATVAGNPHHVTKTEVGLGNVPNIDCTNASNITTGTLPSSVLPALAITDTYVVTGQAGQLALTVQKGDIAVRSDISRTYINKTGNNVSMTDWQELSTPTDTILSINGKVGVVVLTSADITEGSNLYYTESRVSNNVDVAANTAARHGHGNKVIIDAITASFTTQQASAIVANTAKVGITQAQSDAIVANTAKVGITTQQASDITAANTHRAIVSGNPHQVTKTDIGLSNVPNTDFTSDVNANTAARHGHANKAILDMITAPFTTSQANAIVANTAKVGITQAQADAIVANTAKVGITPVQTSAILASTTHDAIISGNPHQVTKTDIGLSNVPNTDFTTDVTLNTAARHGHANKTVLDATTASFTTSQANAIVANTAKVGITQAQSDAIIANTAKVGITTQQSSDIISANAHRATVSGNPHQVTKSDVGLNNVLNIDCTNASNITTGTLPSSVLPALAITDTYVVASQVAQLALTVQKGDIVVRSDISRSYINRTGNNTAMSDWQELSTPTDTILSVNGKVGVVSLTTTDIGEGSNLYYTDARVSANSNVAANTAARHTHVNKASLDLVSGTNTGDQTSVAGNAGTATKLAASRSINGVAFDGSSDITIPVGTGDVTMVGVQTLTNKTLESVKLNKGVIEQVTIGLVGADINATNNGGIQTKALTADTVFTDSLTSGQSVIMHITRSGSYIATWPTITWVSSLGNVAPLLTNASVFVFWKIGTTLYGTSIGSFQ